MSFRTSPPSTSSPFEIVRRSCLLSEDLPFADALTAEHIDEAFKAEGVNFGESGDQPVYTRAVTLWAMVSQGLFTGVQRACSATVFRVAAYYALLGLDISTNTGAYCRARAKVGERVVQRLTEGIAVRCEAAVPEAWKWLGKTVHLVDGSTHSAPDTPENQAEYPQPSSQAAGVGFPLLRTLAIVSLATCMIKAFAIGPYAGKETGETALLRTLFEKLKSGEVVLADRYHAGWFMLALLKVLGVDFVVRLHQHRRADFRRGRRLGAKDHLVTWKKPQRPKWMDQETYDSLPKVLEVRETYVPVNVDGFRTKSLVVASSFLDAEAVSAEDLADLYRQRWRVELHLRDIKSTMKLGVLRGETPARLRQELWTGLLAYNLVRQSMLQAAIKDDLHPHHLSFAAGLQSLETTWLIAALPENTPLTRESLVAVHLLCGVSRRVGNRPDRVEPRAIKRRPSPHKLLRETRAAALAKLRQRAA